VNDKGKMDRFVRWLGGFMPATSPIIFVGVLVDAAIPDILPENALTRGIAQLAHIGVFAIWLYLLWRVLIAIGGLYGSHSSDYLKTAPIWKIIGEVTASYLVAIVCFAVLYVHISRNASGSFSEDLNLGNALYFSIVTITTTG
jgi:hypothetical protein